MKWNVLGKLGGNSRWGKTLILILLDVITVSAVYLFALLLRFDFNYTEIPQQYIDGYVHTILPWIAATVGIFVIARLYHSVWTLASVSELLAVVKAYVLLIPAYIVISVVMGIRMPRSYYIMGFVLSFCCTTAIRFSYRVLRFVSSHDSLFMERSKTGAERVLVVGAGSAGQTIIKEMQVSNKLNVQVCCVIDDNSNKKGKFIEGVRIVGDRHDIVASVKKHKISRIVIAVPTLRGEDRKEILDICKMTKCKLQIIPGVYQMINEEVNVGVLRDVEITDLLGREQVQVNNEEIFRDLENKVIMVTGGGGSIGSELCRQIAKAKPKQLIIFDIYENNAYAIQLELKKKFPTLDLVTLIGSVRNTLRIETVMATYRPDVVFHAAAHKHVPLMEDSPNEAIKNNVFGTYKTAQAADRNGVKKFVLISTDKAVNPTNIMGASKRLCEMVVQMMNRQSKNTSFVAVRFGNVLGSNGSVIPLFKKQIAEGGPVTVTDKRIIRYFMTIPEAVSLVLQASYYANGGEIFVLEMGEPVKIDDMARNLIRLSGLTPDVDIKIEYTGLRPGEKLYEELLMDEEGLKDTQNKLIHIGKPIEMDDDWFRERLQELDEACRQESDHMKKIVAEIVPTYQYKEENQKKPVSIG